MIFDAYNPMNTLSYCEDLSIHNCTILMHFWDSNSARVSFMVDGAKQHSNRLFPPLHMLAPLTQFSKHPLCKKQKVVNSQEKGRRQTDDFRPSEPSSGLKILSFTEKRRFIDKFSFFLHFPALHNHANLLLHLGNQSLSSQFQYIP